MSKCAHFKSLVRFCNKDTVILKFLKLQILSFMNYNFLSKARKF